MTPTIGKQRAEAITTLLSTIMETAECGAETRNVGTGRTGYLSLLVGIMLIMTIPSMIKQIQLAVVGTETYFNDGESKDVTTSSATCCVSGPTRERGKQTKQSRRGIIDLKC